MPYPNANLQDPAESVTTPAPLKLSLLKLAGPTILGNLLLSLVHLAAIKIVGSLGADAVAAVIAADRIYMAIQLIVFSITAGTTALVAYAWGAGNTAEADRVLKLSGMLCLLATLVLCVFIQFFATPLVAIFNLEGETLANAASYLRILVYFNVFFSFLAVIGAALRAAGDALTPVWVTAIGNLVNVSLAYGLVYGRFGLPALGIQGAAYATGISYLLAAVLLFILWQKRCLIMKPLKQSYYKKERARHLVRIAIPAGIEQTIFNVSIIAFMWVVSLYGTDAFTAYGIGVNILSLSIVIGMGFAIATATMVGQQLGAGHAEAAVHSSWRNLKAAFSAMLFIGLLIGLNARLIGSFFIEGDAVLDYLVALMIMLAVVQPMMAIEFTLGGALRGAGDTRAPARITALGFLFGRVLLTLVFYGLGWSVYWIYAALIADYLIKSILYFRAFRKGDWQTAFLRSKPGAY
ncbi:MAG: MATE family efflux transporter [Pseudomonadales bacterium]|nr:MATE family efflux transporter [Pseudomonadales bacterium]